MIFPCAPVHVNRRMSVYSPIQSVFQFIADDLQRTKVFLLLSRLQHGSEKALRESGINNLVFLSDVSAYKM